MVQVAVQSDETPDHHGSHRDLLWAADEPGQKHEIDAIIVPTARTPAYLDEAARLAKSLSCTLVTLHSKRWTSAARAAHRLQRTVDLIAIDIPDPAHLSLPEWETSRLLAGTVFARQTDISANRNVGLVLSRMLGWSRVMFLDDDITRLNPEDVRWASGMLDTHDAVGLQVGGFPDHSVVCHAYRQAGGNQQSFVGGGALAVHLERANSFSLTYIMTTDSSCSVTRESSLSGLREKSGNTRTIHSATRTGRVPRNWAMSSPKASTGCWIKVSRSWMPTKVTGPGSW